MMMITRRYLFKTLTGLGLLRPIAQAQSSSDRPNLVLIISDDLGYADLPLSPRSAIDTPHLNRMATEGTVFDQAYVTAPVCVPSRMGILTGRYPQRFGIYDNMYDPREVKLFFEETTIAQYLKQAGYATAVVGKWHMSGNRFPPNGPTPEQRGFDEWVGIGGGMSNYFPPVTLYRNSKAFEAPEHLTDFFGKEAERFIRKNHKTPFFLYLGFNAPHAPLQAHESDKQGLDESMSPDRRVYAGMVRAMDRNIGRVLGTLRELGLERRTLIAFVNDNGGGGNHTPAHTRNTGRNAPLRGYKFDLFEGGIRVPMIIKWPGRVPPNVRYARPVSSVDLTATLLAAAGIDVSKAAKPLDGSDLIPFVRNPTRPGPHEVLCWENRAWLGPRGAQRPAAGQYNQAVRKGRWKLVRLAGQPHWQLFDLETDIGEQHDLATELPGVVEELDREFRKWRAAMPDPVSLTD